MTKSKKAPIGTDGKPMTSWQIWLRRLCIATLVYSILLLTLAVILLVFGFLPHATSMETLTLFDQEIDVRFLATMLGMSSLVGAVLTAIVSVLGIRGAKNPPKITIFFWVMLIDAVLTAWSLASNFSLGIFDPMSILSGLFIITLATCAWQVRKQTGYFDKHPVPLNGDELK